jgi:hypothetical protein
MTEREWAPLCELMFPLSSFSGPLARFAQRPGVSDRTRLPSSRSGRAGRPIRSNRTSRAKLYRVRSSPGLSIGPRGHPSGAPVPRSAAGRSPSFGKKDLVTSASAGSYSERQPWVATVVAVGSCIDAACSDPGTATSAGSRRPLRYFLPRRPTLIVVFWTTFPV